MAVVTQSPAENAVTKGIGVIALSCVLHAMSRGAYLTLFMTVVIGIYLTIMIANMGGYRGPDHER